MVYGVIRTFTNRELAYWLVYEKYLTGVANLKLSVSHCAAYQQSLVQSILVVDLKQFFHIILSLITLIIINQTVSQYLSITMAYYYLIDRFLSMKENILVESLIWLVSD